jgi:hypothetical protein
VVLGFATGIALGTVLLMLPVAGTTGEPTGLVVALFQLGDRPTRGR